MRRKINTVNITVGESFFKIIDAKRKRFQERIGFRKNITQGAFTEMLARSGKLKLPKINTKDFRIK